MSEDNLLKFLVELATNDDQRARFSNPATKQQAMELAALTPEEQGAINTGDFFTVRRQLGLQDEVPFNQTGHSPAAPSAVKTARKAAKKAAKSAKKAARKAGKAVKKAAKKAVKKAAKAAKKSGGRKR